MDKFDANILEIHHLREQNIQLQRQNEQLEKQVQVLQEKAEVQENTITLLKNKLFGSKSEKRKPVADENDPQMSLFNETEQAADPSVPDPTDETVTEVKGHKRKKKGTRKIDLDAFPQETVMHDLPEEERICKECGHPMHSIGEELHHRELVLIPAQIKVVNHKCRSYECRYCRGHELPYVHKPACPKPVIPHSAASASLIAAIAEAKYVYAVPLYRQEQIFKDMNLPLPRATMANWMIWTGREYLEPLAALLKEELLKQPVLHADETPVQVHKEKGRPNKRKSFVWVYTSGCYERERPVVLMTYHPGRSAAFAKDMLEGYEGYVHTDDYGGYNWIDPERHVLCMVHARRKFSEAKKAAGGVPTPIADEALDRIGELFAIERDLQNMSPEKRQEERQKRARPVLDELFAWAKSILEQMTIKNRLSNALNYLVSNEKGLMRYLDNGMCELSNNMAENSIRPFVVGRKNWLFCDTPRGARTSAIIYSMVETAKANGLNPGKYLEYILGGLSSEEYPGRKETLEQYLPWNPEVQAHCK